MAGDRRRARHHSPARLSGVAGDLRRLPGRASGFVRHRRPAPGRRRGSDRARHHARRLGGRLADQPLVARPQDLCEPARHRQIRAGVLRPGRGHRLGARHGRQSRRADPRKRNRPCRRARQLADAAEHLRHLVAGGRRRQPDGDAGDRVVGASLRRPAAACRRGSEAWRLVACHVTCHVTCHITGHVACAGYRRHPHRRGADRHRGVLPAVAGLKQRARQPRALSRHARLPHRRCR